MKRINRILLILISVVIYASCTQTDHENQLSQKEVTVQIFAKIDNSSNYKSTLRASGNSWQQQDIIGIYTYQGANLLAGVYNNYSNVPYITNDGNGIFTAYTGSNPIIFPKDGSDISFAAYYPHSLDIDAEYNLSLDITNQQSLPAIDLLYSSAIDYNRSNPHVSLLFNHMLSQIIINLSSVNETVSIEGVTATLKNIYPKGNFNLASGSIDALDITQTAININPFIEEPENESIIKARAILIPGQPLNDIQVEIKLKDGSRYTWSPSQAGSMLSGYQYSYQLQLDTDGRIRLLPEGASINPWGDGHHENVYISPSQPIIEHAGYMEIPVPTSGSQHPDAIQVTHMITNRSWLNNSSATMPVRNYSINYDKNERYTKWVAYPLHSAYMTSGNRTNDWGWDPLIPQEYQPNLSSGWSNNTYSRGHMLPSASRSATRDLNRTTFYYTNMAAQETKMNNGVWNELEQKVRVWVEQTGYDTLYVVTGSILPAPPKTIQYTNDNTGKKSAVPEFMYKALLRKHKTTGSYYSIAFKMENRDTGVKYANSVVSVKSLERETGYTFFPMLPPEVADEVKQQTNTTYWN